MESAALLAWMVASVPRCPVFIASSRPRLRSAHFPYDDAVGPMTKNGFEQIVERNLAAVRIGLGFGGDEVRLADMQLRRILNNKNALISGMASASTLAVVLPVPVPPAIRMFCPSRTAPSA